MLEAAYSGHVTPPGHAPVGVTEQPNVKEAKGVESVVSPRPPPLPGREQAAAFRSAGSRAPLRLPGEIPHLSPGTWLTQLLH